MRLSKWVIITNIFVYYWVCDISQTLPMFPTYISIRFESIFVSQTCLKLLSISRVWNISIYDSAAVWALLINEVNRSNWMYQINDLLEVSIFSIEKRLKCSVYNHLIAMYGNKYTPIPILFTLQFKKKYWIIFKVYSFL